MKFQFAPLITTLTFILFVTSCENKTFKSNKEEDSNKVELEILSLDSITDNSYNLTFGITGDTSKKISMTIGKWEAQTLAITLENKKPSVPLPLDLLENAIIRFGFKTEQVTIDGLVGEIYTAEIECSNSKEIIKLKARVADAVTIAYKFRIPIYINKRLII